MNLQTNNPQSTETTPRIERIRHELKRRSLTVSAVERLTPHMLRITLEGEDLADFVSLGTDDHIKIFLPSAGGEPERRDYTPRRYDNATRTLVLDFAVHEAGPATRWALDAKPGSTLDIGGPRGSAVIHGVDRWLLVGDETALPAIGRFIEEAKAGGEITALAAVVGADDEQQFDTRANVTTVWAHRPLADAADASALLQALDAITVTPDTFVWIAAEASVARAVRNRLLERGHSLQWMKAAGYWLMGHADAHEKLES